jgi:hypothetical protein
MNLSFLHGDLPSVLFSGLVRFATRKVAQVTVRTLVRSRCQFSAAPVATLLQAPRPD